MMSFILSWLTKKKYPDMGDDWFGAGIHFTNYKYIVAGYTHKYSSRCITGIGGKREHYEKYYETAIRETLEELFGINPGRELITRISEAINPKHVINNNGYIFMVCSMKDLNKIIRILKMSDVQSAYYELIPDDITQIIIKRLDGISAEIRSIVLFPIESVMEGTLERAVDESLVDDIKILIDRQIVKLRL